LRKIDPEPQPCQISMPEKGIFLLLLQKLADVLLDSLFEELPFLSCSGDLNTEVNSITADSRQARPGSLFVAVKGTLTDGHQYISDALAKGAVAVVCEIAPTSKPLGVTFIEVADSAGVLGWLASAFYGNPSSKLKLVAVTGTNGKTTTVTLLFRLFRELGYNTALLSTVQNQLNEEVFAATHTTPEPVALNQFLAEAVRRGCTHAFMEASSHAIVQQRIAGLHFTGAVFTNISHDHLDFHKTFENYIRAKKLLFDRLPDTAFALSNIDDKRGMVMLQNTRARKKTFSLQALGDYKGRVLSNTLQGLEMDFDGQLVWCRLVGLFNAYNLLGIYATALLLGEEPQHVLTHLSALPPARGRFEQVLSQKGVIGIIDYAHTPDALENVLSTIADLRQEGRIVTVIGCGGNRDTSKRPIMARIACQYSDQVLLTSDNPRNEDPLDILHQMEAGAEAHQQHKVKVIPDRLEAIRRAVQMAQQGDILLIAGKGHETYQEIKGVKYPFDDLKVLEEAFATG
jgi:UDP-N-acetylmuramoyl-L-alanyl-D-glutamate--2,6-diaminopimelate ligase